MAHVALGANLDEPVTTMVAALLALGALGTVGPVSSLWATDPVGGPPDQPNFRNAVAVWRPGLAWSRPGVALGALLAIEQALGRERRARWGPRRIDLDLLAWHDEEGAAPTSGPRAAGAARPTGRGPWPDLPHPRALERPFVLVPWAEVAPGWFHPRAGTSIADAAAAAGAGGVHAVGPGERTRWAAAVDACSGAGLPPR